MICNIPIYQDQITGCTIGGRNINSFRNATNSCSVNEYLVTFPFVHYFGITSYNLNATDDWKWFENYMTYANSVLPEAMLYTYLITGKSAYKNVAIESFDFLLSKMFVNGYFKVISNKGWYQKGEDQLFHGATAVIVIGSKPGASCPHDDALLATQNILLGAHAMGLGSCLIGFAVHALNNDPKIKREFDIPATEQIYSVIALGHPSEKYIRPTGRRQPLIRTL